MSQPIIFYFGKNSIHTSEDFFYQAKDIPDHIKKEYVTNLLLYSLDEQLHHHGKSLQDFPGIPQPSHTSTLSCHVQFNLDEQLQLAEKNESLLNKRPNFCLQHHNCCSSWIFKTKDIFC